MIRESGFFFDDPALAEQSLCKSLPPERRDRLFFGIGMPEGTPEARKQAWQNTVQAKAVCAGCGVKEACATLAIETGDTEVGVRGEMAPRELKAERLRRRREAGEVTPHQPKSLSYPGLKRNSQRG